MASQITEILMRAREEKMTDSELSRVLERYSVDVEDMANLVIIDEDEESSLWERIADGDESAKSELIDKHMALVTSIALEYIGEGKSLLELIDLGMDGIKTAVTRYDKRVGYAFAVHAVWWIRQTIVRGCN